MSTEIAPGVRYMTREDWGVRIDLRRLGEPISSAARTEAIHHHTVAVDNDATPNLWETEAEIKPKMRQLQTIRPDLGLDVPYNFVAFLMYYHLGARGIILCEGRGGRRRGAHTKYHNRTGIAVAIEGNLDLAVNVGPYVEMLSAMWGWIKDEHGLVSLGSVRPPRGQVWGHQQFRDPNDRSTWTACPGASLMLVLADITIGPEEPEEEETEMQLLQTPGGYVYTYVFGKSPRYIESGEDLERHRREGIWPQEIRQVSGLTIAALKRGPR